MPSINFPRVSSGMSVEQLADLVARCLKEVEWLSNGNIDSHNVRNIAGFNVDRYIFKHESGIVGLSGASPNDPTAIRFWAGLANMLAAPFRVNQSGQLFATDAFITGLITGSTIIGGVIKTADTGARIELTGGFLKGYSAANNLHGLVFNPTPTSNFFDLFIYHDGTKYMEFYDDGLFIQMRPTISTGLGIGGSAGPIKMTGQWNATSCTGVTGTIPGNCSTANYATTAGTANTSASADMATAIQPTGIANGTYTKLQIGTDGRAYSGTTLSASDIPTIAESQVSGLTTDLASKANKTLPSWTAPTLLNSWVNYGSGFAVAGYYKNDFGEVQCKGVIKSGTATLNTILFNLPVGYRPLEQLIFPSVSNDAFGEVQVKANGDVLIVVGSNSSLSLNNIRFRAEQ